MSKSTKTRRGWHSDGARLVDERGKFDHQRFVRPVPIEVDVALRGSLVEVDGRKIRVEAAIVVHGEIAVEASATFITVTGDRFGAFG